ncbi:IscS subfamily cysteine desulfurase [Salipaludibacillus daqingensis]|uniref:IscS subfamily cysteine desulfurase n=1 Tax=Salipaludibacillus daqingensis TaxID=3041001 RepID=UPI0024735F54|nr:IscS subfamily cysteine desulfurase [Salipaludibacillus daqingensis]
MIYLDHAATTIMSTEAMETWIKATQNYFANANSLHEAGEQSSQLLLACRNKLASLVNTTPEQVFFTSGGSESNYLALNSLYQANKHLGNHVITTAIEHPTVHSFFQQMERQGVEVTYLPVDQFGLVSMDSVKKATKEDTILASIQHVNSETGVIQPLKEFGSFFKANNIIFHSDCVQSFGKTPILLPTIGVDAISVSSHKIHGPKGVGAVFFGEQVKWSSVYPLTSHQRGFRPGTLNIPGIAAFTTAAMDMYEYMEDNWAKAKKLREVFLTELKPLEDRLKIEGHPTHQLPWIIGLAIHGVQGQYMLLSLDRFQICISTGSACQSEELDGSSAMHAIYSTEQERLRFFRISFGKNTTLEEIIFVTNKIKEIAHE